MRVDVGVEGIFILIPAFESNADAILRWMENLLAERFGHSWHLRLECSMLSLTLEGGEGRITFDPVEQTFLRGGPDLPCTQWDAEAEGWLSVLGTPLPMPGRSKSNVPLVERRGSNYHVYYDLLGLTYWMLNRIEEIGRTDLDSHGRFPATASHAYRHGYLERPIVDEWLNILSQVIRRIWPNISLKVNRPRVRISHDVDVPSRYGFRPFSGIARGLIGDVMRGDFLSAAWAPWIRLNSKNELHRKDPYNTFDWIMRTSEAYGLKSAFYFISGRTNSKLDSDYELSHPAIGRLMNEIHLRGHEIGLHGSYETSLNAKSLASEMLQLRHVAASHHIAQDCWGGRMHYLRWSHPATLRVLESAGVMYDSTLGYADRPGFRCGTCFEYQAFDPVAQRSLELRIRPLIAMEVAVMDAPYLALGATPAALNVFDTLKAACFRVGGDFVVLWHNSSLQRVEQLQLYRQVISPFVNQSHLGKIETLI